MKIIKHQDLSEEFYKYQEFSAIDSVSKIIEDVKNYGDKAVREYSLKFGDGEIENLELTEDEIDYALNEIPDEILKSINKAAENIKKFAQAQLNSIKEIEININGSKLGHKIIPLKKTGAYVPGGNYPLPSSALMSVIPAKISGVQEVIVCSPKIKNVTVAACALAGADRIFRIGGVQAIAAMAYGTETIPAVNKITGPGNKYVTAAKKQVYGVCGIDFLAGPSEVLIIADETANPKFIAADMLAQAEHDSDARAYVLTTSEKIAQETVQQIDKFLKILDTSEIASKAISESLIILVENINQAVEISNKKAPEHLEICYNQAEKDINKYTNYGSLFIGNFSAEVFGDYCSGTNHVLPTNGVSRYSGGLSVFDFIKILTWQNISQKTAQETLSGVASVFAEAEGLFAHKLSADLRKYITASMNLRDKV
jgi:histidinol dehydrogenase